jgi:hypothetical protein
VEKCEINIGDQIESVDPTDEIANYLFSNGPRMKRTFVSQLNLHETTVDNILTNSDLFERDGNVYKLTTAGREKYDPKNKQ